MNQEFKPLDGLDEDGPILSWSEQSDDFGDTPPCSPALSNCLSPGSAHKAVTSGALIAQEQHERDEERRRSIGIANKSSTADEEEDGEVWVRSVSGEHEVDARKSIYLQATATLALKHM